MLVCIPIDVIDIPYGADSTVLAGAVSIIIAAVTQMGKTLRTEDLGFCLGRSNAPFVIGHNGTAFLYTTWFYMVEGRCGRMQHALEPR